VCLGARAHNLSNVTAAPLGYVPVLVGLSTIDLRCVKCCKKEHSRPWEPADRSVNLLKNRPARLFD
jgi:hypothetical protein